MARDCGQIRMNVCADDEVGRLMAIAHQRFGLSVDESRGRELLETIRVRARQFGGAQHYLDVLEQGTAPQSELDTLAEIVTVGETCFYRNAAHFEVLTQVALRELAAARESGSINILSVGCASGDEAYTIVMAVHDRFPAVGRDLSVRAVDVNPAALVKARSASFSDWSLRNTPAEQRARWFRVSGKQYVLDDNIRRAVQFEQGNLAQDDAVLWAPSSYDVVFCRNVLMYFSPAAARAAIARIARSMVPGGYLFLGEAETLRGLSTAFDLRHTHGAFYYQLDTHPCDVRAAAAVASPAVQRWGSGASDAWFDTIREATERIDEIARSTPQEATQPPIDLNDARALIQRERFADALQQLAGIAADTANTEALLLRAVSLVHTGNLDACEATCQRLLELDGLSAGTHYLLALCREGRGDTAGSRQHAAMALHIEPHFAMARLHLGLIARREGRRDVAAAELSEALTGLEREDASRIVLFGGGFSREALLSMCRGALAVTTPTATR